MAGPSRRRSPRNAANAENAPAPSPVADTPSKTTTRADGGAVPEKENPAHEATPSSILKRRRRSILSDVSKATGADAGANASPNARAALKKRRQSLANRRVSFAVDTALESVREFAKDEGAEGSGLDAVAFPDPVTATAASSSAKPVATLASCPPPAPIVVAPSPAPAPTPTPTPTPAPHVTPTATDPFLAFGVSPAASGGSKSHATPSEDGTIAFSHGVMSTPGSNLNLTGNLAGGGGGRPSDATSHGTGTVGAFDLGDTPNVANATPMSANGGGGGAPTPNSGPGSVDIGNVFSKNLPRRVTMDPSQYRDAMKAAGNDLTTTPTITESGGLDDDEDDDEVDDEDGGELGMHDDGVTASVPGLAALADEDEDEDETEAGHAPVGMSAPGHTAAFKYDASAAANANANEITAAVPSLSSLAADDEDDDDHLATVNVHDVSKHSTNSSEASPALCGLPMGSVTEDVAANMAADLAAAVAADQAKNIAGGAGGASASASASASSNDGDDYTMAMDLGYTTMLPTRQNAVSKGGATPTVNFPPPGAGGPTPTATALSDFNFTSALEAGAHGVWGAARDTPGGGVNGVTMTVEMTQALNARRKSMAAQALERKRRMTLGVKGVAGFAHPADRRKSRAPFAMPHGISPGGAHTMTVDLDANGAKVMGKDTFEFVYGGQDKTGEPGRPSDATKTSASGFGDFAASTPTLTDLSFGGAAVNDNAAGSNANADGVDLNLSDSFEAPPGKTSLASSGNDTWDKSKTTTTTTTPAASSLPGPSTDRENTGFTLPGDDTMRLLLKNKLGEHGDATPAPPSDGNAATDGSTGSAAPPAVDENHAAADPTKTSKRTTTDTWDKALTDTTGDVLVPMPGVHNGHTMTVTGVVPFATPHESLKAPSVAGSAGAASSTGGFTPGDETLEMIEKLKAREHGFTAKTPGTHAGRPSTLGWGFASALGTPLPPLGGAAPTAFTPNRNTSIAGGAPGSGFKTRNGHGFAGPGFDPAPAFGRQYGDAAFGAFTPGGSQRDTLRGAKALNDAKTLEGALGLPADCPPIPDVGGVVELETFLHACEVSFMEARNLRRKSLAMESLSNAPPPSNVYEGLKLVCLTAPMIEALEPMHEHLSDALASDAKDIDRLKLDVERAQPPLLRLASSDDPAHVAALQRAGKMLKKECQLAAKDDFTSHRLLTERAVAESLVVAAAALQRTETSLTHSREIAAEACAAADAHEADLRERIDACGDAAASRDRLLTTRRGLLAALAQRRRLVDDAKRKLRETNDDVVAMTRRGGVVQAEHSRFSAQLEEARAVAAQKGVELPEDGGASARSAAAARAKKAGEACRALGEELAVLNRVTPWRLDGLSGGGDTLSLRVGRLFRIALDVGTGAGRVTLQPCSGVTPQGGVAFAAAVAGAPRAWNETSENARNGHLAAVLQSIVPGLRRAEATLGEAEACRDAFPRITKMRCTAGGGLELSFTDFNMERKVDVALDFSRGAYPRGKLSPRVAVVYHGTGPPLPSAATMEAAIDRVPSGACGRRLFGICRLMDWIVARGEEGAFLHWSPYDPVGVVNADP